MKIYFAHGFSLAIAQVIISFSILARKRRPDLVHAQRRYLSTLLSRGVPSFELAILDGFNFTSPLIEIF